MRTRAMPTSDHFYSLGFPGGASGKEYAGQSGDIRDAGSIPGSGRCPGEENDNLLQYACLVNLMDGEPGRLQYMGLQRIGHD